MAVQPSSPSYTLADLNRLGHSCGQHYSAGAPGPHQDQPEVAQGCTDQHAVRSGLWLHASDLQVHQHYRSQWRAPPHFSVITLLQGKLQLQNQSDFELCAQGGVSAPCGDHPLVIHHRPAQQVRSLSLSVLAADIGDDQSSELLAKALAGQHPNLRPWTLHPHLALAIAHLLDCMWRGALDHLLREGTALQLLSHGLHCFVDAPRRRPQQQISPRDRQMLERVRQKLHACPGDDHSLTDLASLACMSPSTLRAKFQVAYRCSVFNWLRQRRLEVAREHLAQGWSVQQAAHYVGYRHATNFATAFRERYGICPSHLVPD